MNRFTRFILILSMVSLALGFPLSQVSAASGVLLTKSASSDNATLGDNIIYTYTIHAYDNCFEAKLVDDKIGEIDIPDQLQAGENITATAAHVVSLSDYSVDAAKLVNTATFTGSVAGAENITVTATASVALKPYQASLVVTKEADKSVAGLGEVITYSYTVSNYGVVEITGISLTDNPLGNISLFSDNVTSLAPGENITAKATYTVVFDDLRAGSVTNTATVTGTDPNGNPVTADSGEVKVSTNVFLSLLTKAGILKSTGVTGKGIDQAPGLQKPFNPNSQASQHAGKKDGQGELEQNQNQQMSGTNAQNQEQEMNAGGGQDSGQEMNNNDQQNENQEKNKNKDKDKGNGRGKNNK